MPQPILPSDGHDRTHPTPVALLIGFWLLVAIPLGWGVYQSILKSAPLFKAPPQTDSITR